MGLHICMSGNPSCSGIMPCAACHGARSQVLARAFAMAGMVDRAQMQTFFQVYTAVWADFQAQVLAALPPVPPTLNGAEPPEGHGETMPAPPEGSIPPTPPVGMSEGLMPVAEPSAGSLGEPPVVAEEVEKDMMAPMTELELKALMSQAAQNTLPVEGPEPVATVAVAAEEKPKLVKEAPRPDRGSKREGNEAAMQKEEGTT